MVREILFDDYNYELNPQSQLFKEVRHLMTDSLTKIIEQSKQEERPSNSDDLNLLYGTLEVVADLIRVVQPGSEVDIFLNDKQSTATVVDGEYYSGKLDMSFIIDNESTITTLSRDQVAIGKIRNYSQRSSLEVQSSKTSDSFNRLNWKTELLPDAELINKAIVGCFKWLQNTNKKQSYHSAESMSLLLLMLLKISDAQITSRSETDGTNSIDIIEPLLTIWNEYHSKAVETPSDECELELCEAWRRIIDKLEPVLNYHYTIPPQKKSTNESSNIVPNNSDFVINEHALPSSGYDQLPAPKAQANESKAAIRLLAYWEKNIIPKIIDFVKSTYKPWEMEFYFEQLRFPLRNGDQQKALDEAMVMCEQKMPAGAVVPDDSYDWSAKMPEECIVGSRFLVKLSELKPMFGVEEIVVTLKAIDLETKIGFVEYIDSSSMRYNIWIPLKYIYDLPVPLNTPAV